MSMLMGEEHTHVRSHSCELLLSSVPMFFLRSMLTSDDGPESVEVDNVAL